MSNWYVRSGAAGTANGAEWTDAYTTVNAALTATNTAPGDIIWVSDDHNEISTANITLYSANATMAGPLYVLCANHSSGNLPPNPNTDLQLTANIVSNGTIAFGNGCMNFYGLNFYVGSGVATNFAWNFGAGTAGNKYKFDYCNFTLNSGATSAFFLNGGGSSSKVSFNICQFNFAAVAQHFQTVGGWVAFTSCTIGGSTLPNNLFQNASGSQGEIILRIRKCNFSNLGSGHTLFNPTNGVPAAPMFATLEDCIVNSSVSIANQSGISYASYVHMVRSFTPYGEYYLDGYGVNQDSNSVYRVSGASDGTYNKSRNVTTFANTSIPHPFSTLNPLTRFNTVVGSPITARIYGTWNGATVPNNNVMWLDVEYFGASGNTITSTSSSGPGSTANSSVYVPNTPTSALTVDTTSTWVGGGTNNFYTSVTFTPQAPGMLRGWVRFGAASIAAANLYYDPVLYLYDASNNLLSSTSLTYDTLYSTINETGPVGLSGLIIQGL